MGFLKLLLLLVLFTAVANMANAGEGHTTLLATSQPAAHGVTADLYLRTEPGSGRIFIETIPLTKVDTQISTRFANEVACSYLGVDCSRTDFFYTITADAGIIGGPSAGAAMTALTVAVLQDAELNSSVSVTGTINSGYVIGNVGGIIEKLEAAKGSGIRKVLIPKGEVIAYVGNETLDVRDYGESIGLEVVEVFTLDDVLNGFSSGIKLPSYGPIEVDPSYSRVMENLADKFCTRTLEISAKINLSGSFAGGFNSSFEEVEVSAKNLSMQGFAAKGNGSYYAAASFCFGANVRYRYLGLLSQNLSTGNISSRLSSVEAAINDFTGILKEANTVSDAQILAIVLDRSSESRNHANSSRAFLEAGSGSNAVFELAFAIERLNSAQAWGNFFGVVQEHAISQEDIRNACVSKLAEAQERVEYSRILLSSANGAGASLDLAQKFFDEGSYVQCLHRATISKAEANVMLSVAGADDSEVSGIVSRKLEAAKVSIARQSSKGMFPVVGYSYFEYSASLKDFDKYSALLFSEYALEFSNLDIYFKDSLGSPVGKGVIADSSIKTTLSFIAGLIAGFLAAFGFISVAGKKKKRILVRASGKRLRMK